MTVLLKTIEPVPEVIMPEIGRRARTAARLLALAPTAQKDAALAAMAEAVRARKSAILAANAEDIAEAKASGATAAFLDRLALEEGRGRPGGFGLGDILGVGREDRGFAGANRLGHRSEGRVLLRGRRKREQTRGSARPPPDLGHDDLGDGFDRLEQHGHGIDPGRLPNISSPQSNGPPTASGTRVETRRRCRHVRVCLARAP